MKTQNGENSFSFTTHCKNRTIRLNITYRIAIRTLNAIFVVVENAHVSLVLQIYILFFPYYTILLVVKYVHHLAL